MSAAFFPACQFPRSLTLQPLKPIRNVNGALGFVATAARPGSTRSGFLGVCGIVYYLYDLLRLTVLVNDVHLSSAISLVISDVDGQLRGLQLLVAVSLTAAPDVNVLHQDENDLMRTQHSSSGTTVHAQAR